MKIRFIAAGLLATAAFSGPVLAQSSITLYGVADLYAQLGKGNRTETALESGGYSGSRLGFKGRKVLVDSLSAVFQLEAGIAVDKGVSTQGGRLFGRQAYAGVSDTWGTLTAGRQYTPEFLSVDNADPMSTGVGSAANSGVLSLLVVRADNSIVYAAPKMGPVSVNAMVSLGETSSGSTTNGNLYAANVEYAAGPLDLNVSLTSQNRATDAGVNASIALVTGIYDFGSFKLMGGLQGVRHPSGVAGANDDRNEVFAGVQIPVGKDLIALGGYSSRARVSSSGMTASQVSAEYIHNITKDFLTYGTLTSIKNGAATSYTTDGATGAGPAVSAGKKASALQVGFRYMF
ncbi:MAG: porin [Burkholderiales bacterium]|nr:porin [Burkholderiales bacterium]MDE1927309.1 porin [Burkholderiales bacterium]MDE2159981.1 porin [Burkholderiales bacterium]MDE2504518.1 porin [Burkholderiales bacterium]